jgi:tetratricopeptide (TPR) repeat protein
VVGAGSGVASAGGSGVGSDGGGSAASPPAGSGVGSDGSGGSAGSGSATPNPNPPKDRDRSDRDRDRAERDRARRDAARAKVEGAPRTEKDAAELLADARTALAAFDYAKAREQFGRVAQSRFYRGQGYLGQAKVAWETKDVDGAIALAEKALGVGAGDPARILLGHAYYKKNELSKALGYYEAVLKHNPKDQEAQRSADLVKSKLGGGN